MSYFIGLTRWDETRLQRIGQLSDAVQGVILGDPFCARRMFQQGNADILTLAAQAREHSLKVAVQTPVYLTPRNYRETVDLIRALHRKNQVHLVLAHSMGILGSLHDMGLPACWSLWGETRNKTLNREFVDLLLERGVKYLETDNADRITALQQHGMGVAYRLQSSFVATFGRSCYHTMLADMACSENHRPCLERTVHLVDHDSQDQLLVDGHILCRDKPAVITFPKAQPDITTVFSTDVANLPDIISQSRARDNSEAYRRLHRQFADAPTATLLDALVNISILRGVPSILPEVASILFALASSIRPRRILEIGSGCGYSSALLAFAAEESTVTALECDETLAADGRRTLQDSKYAERITWHVGDARRIMPTLKERFDLVFMDAAKQEYPDYLRALLPLLATGAVIITDDAVFNANAWDSGSVKGQIEAGLAEFRELIQQPPYLTTALKVGQGLTLTKYLGERSITP